MINIEGVRCWHLNEHHLPRVVVMISIGLSSLLPIKQINNLKGMT